MESIFKFILEHLHGNTQHNDSLPPVAATKSPVIQEIQLTEIPEIHLPEIPEILLPDVNEGNNVTEKQTTTQFIQASEQDNGIGVVDKRIMANPRKKTSFKKPVLAVKTKISEAEAKQILSMHRSAREDARGSNILEIEWDDDLARLAQGLADTCFWGHENMMLPNGGKVGQNLAYDQNFPRQIKSMVNLWLEEKANYDPYTGGCSSVCGHYTQMVWGKTTEVGCGVATCPDIGAYLVCDYKPAGNFQGEKAFEVGDPCSQCNLDPGTRCDQGMCSPCDPKQHTDCIPYDASKCLDALLDGNLKTCEWIKHYCHDTKYRKYIETNCAKTCGFCK